MKFLKQDVKITLLPFVGHLQEMGGWQLAKPTLKVWSKVSFRENLQSSMAGMEVQDRGEVGKGNLDGVSVFPKAERVDMQWKENLFFNCNKEKGETKRK